MSIRKIARLGLYTSIALIIFTIEAALPGLAPIPGIKLGLANIVTLYVLSNDSIKDAILVLIMRIILAALLAGQAVSFLYSLSGGILCLVAMAIVHRLVGRRYLYLTSIMGAVAHNIGQIGVAYFIMKLSGIVMYTPYLIISGIVTGLFTGLVCGFMNKYMPRYILSEAEGKKGDK